MQSYLIRLLELSSVWLKPQYLFLVRGAKRLGLARIFLLTAAFAVILGVNLWSGERLFAGRFLAETLGGPTESEEAGLPPIEALAPNNDVVAPVVQSSSISGNPIVFAEEDTLGGVANPANEAPRWIPDEAEIIEYIVAEGDSVASIAQKYGVSAETILWANNLTAGSLLKPGDKLRFPSVSGLLHKIGKGETLGSISSRYGVPQDWILVANDITSDTISEGEELIIPGARPVSNSVSRPAVLPPTRITAANVNIAGYFRAPTIGLNWGIKHYDNAVDIANSCGTPVWASASGVVIFATWYNDAYGNFIIIAHPNGAITRYAHLSKIEVSVGAAVEQGDEIGLIGNTGKVRGITGCHLHFEVMGATNPFIRY